mmetsp:Transcript_27664/g.42100  ORF Transcript_27664/g.42100 Transcript_27664/m.42100 type:complete len:114 (+) Transcript_27664:172-513(+)
MRPLTPSLTSRGAHLPFSFRLCIANASQLLSEFHPQAKLAVPNIKLRSNVQQSKVRIQSFRPMLECPICHYTIPPNVIRMGLRPQGSTKGFQTGQHVRASYPWRLQIRLSTSP